MIKASALALCGLSLWLLSIEVSKFDPNNGYLSSVSLRLQMVYSNTWILWFNRQMDLTEKWTKFLTVLLVLVLAYTTFIFTATSFTFFQRSERNTSTFLSRCMVYNFMVKIFRFQLRHHACLIKPTLLQLHYRTSLTTLLYTCSTYDHYTWSTYVHYIT